MNQRTIVKLSLYLNYFVFAILLNSVGAVILQVQRNFDVTKSAASVLEGFKDLPIAFASFLLASFLPKFGLKNSMLVGLGLVSAACFVMPFANEFWYFKLLFFTIRVSFALIKVTVYATIGLVTNGQQEHSSFMSSLEGLFMVGVLSGNILFSLFIDDNNPKSEVWLNVYWILGVLSLLALGFLWTAKLDESKAKVENRALSDDFMAMIKLIVLPLVLVFIASAFLFVLIEQSFQTWTPTFYEDILKVPASMSIQAAAVLAGAFAIGRFSAGFLLKRINWIYVVVGCIIGCALMVTISLPLTTGIAISENTSWFNAPLVVYLFPLMGIFLSPIYPAINSVILSALPKHQHSAMSGLIVVFSALGGTTGSIITGNVFEHFSGQTAFYMSLIPMGLLLIALLLLKRLTTKTTLVN
jgi:fucose permease